MRIVALNSSPRKKRSRTRKLAEAVLDGAETQGAKATPRRKATARPRQVRRNLLTIAATRVVKAALHRPRLFAPPPDREPVRHARVGFLVGYRGCFHQGTERKTVVREIDLECRGPLQAALNQCF